ncbi:MAG: trigger factor [Actinomycetes bacterium]
MEASVTVLENNRVKLTVEVEAAAIEKAIEATAKVFAEDISVKGFRKGKAPRSLIEARIGGAKVLRAEALNSSIPDFYARAVADTMIDPIAQPSIDITAGEDEGDLSFTAEVEVRPELTIAGHQSLTVTLPSIIPSDDEIEAQINRLRDADAELVRVERGVLDNDVVTLNVLGTDPSDAENVIDVDDYVYTVGSDALTDGVDELIIGLKAGETLELIGRGPGGIAMTWKLDIVAVNERVLPELTDEWAEQNSEYATVDALREGLVNQLTRMKAVEAQMARRDQTLLALANLIAEEDVPEALVQSEIDYRLHDLEHRLSSQRLDLETFLRVTNQTPDQLVDVLKEDAKKSVRIDLGLRALAKAESLEPTPEDVEQELAITAESMNVTPEILSANLEETGRKIAFYAEVAKMKASRWLYDNVKYVDGNGAELDKELFAENQADAFGLN